jgi:hypothetical protein
MRSKNWLSRVLKNSDFGWSSASAPEILQSEESLSAKNIRKDCKENHLSAIYCLLPCSALFQMSPAVILDPACYSRVRDLARSKPRMTLTNLGQRISNLATTLPVIARRRESVFIKLLSPADGIQRAGVVFCCLMFPLDGRGQWFRSVLTRPAQPAFGICTRESYFEWP